jgi:hypothetical protein
VYDDRRDREYALRSVRQQLIQKAGEIVLDSDTPVCLKANVVDGQAGGPRPGGEPYPVRAIRGELEFRAVRTLDQCQIKPVPIDWRPPASPKKPTFWQSLKGLFGIK